jgi:chromosome segregation protein
VAEDLFTASPEYSTAIGVALGRSAQYLICTTPEVAQQAIKFLRNQAGGRASFLPLTAVERWAEKERQPQCRTGSEVLGRLSELVGCEQQYRQVAEFLLGRTYLTADLKGARQFAERNSYRVRAVTLEGDLIQPGGLITGGRAGDQLSAASKRKQEIARLAVQLSAGKEHLKALTERGEALAESLRQTRQMTEQSEQAGRRHSQELNEARQQLALLEQELKQTADFQQDSLLAGAENSDDCSQLESEISRMEKELSQLQAEEKRLEETRNRSAARRQQAEDDLQHQDSELAEVKAKVSSLEQEWKHLTGQKELQGRDKEKKEREIEQARQVLADLLLQIDGLASGSQATAERLRQLSDEAQAAEACLRLYRRKLQAEQQQAHYKEQRVRKYRELSREGEQRLRNLDLQQNHLEQEMEEIRSRAAEIGFTLSPEQMLRGLQRHEETQIKERMAGCKQQLAEIGEVNFAAPAAYRELQERYDFLREQQQDLEQGKEELEQVIEEMDRTVSRQFLDTFDQVRQNFSEIYASLCDGGEADLLLTDRSDPLDTGVEMVVTPRGKRPRHLSLLSGGERALAGIAFLFALLRTRPSPFYLLDEIEAFLDEANLNRFADFLRQMGESSQLVLISHRFQTMEAADMLYGITMEEPGVSKIVSVKLEAAKEQVIS